MYWQSIQLEQIILFFPYDWLIVLFHAWMIQLCHWWSIINNDLQTAGMFTSVDYGVLSDYLIFVITAVNSSANDCFW